jgi:anti-sigma factor RsiW
MLRGQPHTTRPLSFREVTRLLQSLLDGEIDETLAHTTTDHLEQCRRCGLEARTYLTIKAALAQRRRPDTTQSADSRTSANRSPGTTTTHPADTGPIQGGSQQTTTA